MATQQNPGVAVPIATGSPERFGYSWQNYCEILPEHEEQFLRWTAPLKREDWGNVTFLDVGCGIGRNSYWPMVYGAREGLAIDVDERTLASARKNLDDFKGIEVRFQSVYELDESSRFDIVYSIGVVHHLEFPELAVGKMAAAAKPGGKVLVWLYGYENNQWIVRVADPLRKALFSRMPLGLVHAMSLPITSPTFALAGHFLSSRQKIPFAFNVGTAKIGENRLGEDLASFLRCQSLACCC